MTNVYIVDTTKGIKLAIDQMFSYLEQSGPILKSSKEVYIKVNGVDFKKHCYTSPEVLEAVIMYLRKNLSAKVYVMENSTQANVTRVVFALTEYKAICEKAGAEMIYLDEEESKTFEFKGKPSIQDDPKGYKLKTFRMPKTIVKIMENRDSITYINIPKLKTHPEARVTLGIKNQWAFPQHEDRGKDHNFNLHSKIIDVYEYIKPDLTIIDGIEGTIHGHYPPAAFADRLVKKFNILIGGRDTLAVDVVGARIFGLTREEIPHLQIAYERGLGEGDLKKIKVIGKDLEDYKEKYDWNILQEFPNNVKIVEGKDLICIEGCLNNSLLLLQWFAYDFPDKFKGDWFLIMGKGHDEDLVEKLTKEGYTKGLVAGYCAIDEVGQKLQDAFGKRKVFFSGDCNNLAETTKAMLKLARMTVFDLVPISTEELMPIIEEAKKHGTTALTPL